MSIKNASTLPKVYYGLHFAPGVAEYKEPGKDPYRIMIEEKAIKNMDPSFQGRPVYVKHVDEVQLDKLQTEADGYVVESFFNSSDGKHWAKFIVVSDKGHEAISRGWKLSNAYIPKSLSGGGLWHGVQYDKEVISGEYEHLAIVPNPRYEESVIMTPEQFKQYNIDKESDLKRFANSKGDSPMLNFFRKQKVENAIEFETMLVTLPKSKREVSLVQLINEADEPKQEVKAMDCYANGDHKVKVGEEEMTVNELIAKHMDMVSASKDLPQKESEPAGQAQVDAPKQNEDEEKKKKEAEMKMAAEKKQNEDEEKKKKEAEMATKNAHFEALKNAPQDHAQAQVVDLASDKVARGKARYGSGK